MAELLDFILRYWLQILFGAIAGVVVWLVRQFKAYRKGLIVLLRNTIIKNHDDYIERGYIPLYAMENVTHAYEAYHDLGENGAMTKFYNELKELPSNPPKLQKVKVEECGNTCLMQHKIDPS